MRSIVALLTTTFLCLVVGGGVANAAPAPLDEGPPRGDGTLPAVGTSSSLVPDVNTLASIAIIIGIVGLAVTLVTHHRQHRQAHL
ncbi:MAG: hypothetical protein ACXV4A_03640 [Actinomycetes bacterium]